MGIRKPTYMCDFLVDIKSETLEEMGVSVILLDVDNTLAEHNSAQPADGTIEWVHEMLEKGFRLIIVSNNYEHRVKPFAEKYGLPFITFACKPLPIGYIKAKRHFGVKSKDCVVIGDQIYTDIIGANLCKMKSVLVAPFVKEDSKSFKIRRKLEMRHRKRFLKSQEEKEGK